MSYRVAFIIPIYPRFHAEMLQKMYQPHSKRASYDKLRLDVAQTAFGSTSLFAKHFLKLGRDCIEIYPNLSFLQREWADQNLSGKYSSDISEDQILIEQINSFAPDIIFFLSLDNYDRIFRSQLRLSLRKSAKVVTWKLSYLKSLADYSDLDLVLTGSKEWQALFKQHSINSEYIACAAHLPEQEIKALDRKIPLSFCGTLSDSGAHLERTLTIGRLITQSNLELWVDYHESRCKLGLLPHKSVITLPDISYRKYRMIYPFYFLQARLVSAFSKIYPERIHQAVAGLDYYSVLASSEITLNLHCRLEGLWAGNIRLFEACAAGACLLTEFRDNISEFYQPDVEVVTFKSTAEALDKVSYLQKNPAVIKEIAAAGKKKALDKHCMSVRSLEYDNAFFKLLKSI